MELMDSRLSSLPDDIIQKILFTLSMKDVIKTSVLSSRWRYIWTSMSCLNFSFDEYFEWWHKGKWFNSGDDEFAFDQFIQFVKHHMSRRYNQVSYVKLNTNAAVSPRYIEKIINCILSHNVQQVDVECMLRVDDDSDLTITQSSSQSLKRLSLTMEHVHGFSQYVTTSLNLELPALTTLYLSCVGLYFDDNTLFSKCPNLKNLTLKSCIMKGTDSLTICHQRLSNLTLERDMGSATVVNVVAPQLEYLTIRYRFKEYKFLSSHESTYLRGCLREYKHLIYAPNLISLVYEGYDPLPLSTNGFHSLEKVDLCIFSISQQAAEALEVFRLFQQIQSVKFLKLNLEILELLSSHVQMISHHPPPFANLKSMDIYPKILNACETPMDITEVKNYLLDSSPGATFTMVSREEAAADMNATQARLQMADLKRYLDTEKDIIETNQDHMQQPTESMYSDDDNREPETQMQLQIREVTKQIKSCWIDHKELIHRGNRIVDNITSDLENIEKTLTELPASKRAMLQPCFSSLSAESVTFLSKMAERIKIHISENLNNASDCLDELATSLQSS